jgi:hypothetical protein
MICLKIEIFGWSVYPAPEYMLDEDKFLSFIERYHQK